MRIIGTYGAVLFLAGLALMVPQPLTLTPWQEAGMFISGLLFCLFMGLVVDTLAQVAK